VVKLVLGSTLGDLSSSLPGNVPGVALWDERGRSIGTTPGTSEILGEGNFVNIQVVANSEVGNIRPSSISQFRKEGTMQSASLASLSPFRTILKRLGMAMLPRPAVARPLKRVRIWRGPS
jgi:hypothetical protein